MKNIENIEQLKDLLVKAMNLSGHRFTKDFRQADEDSDLYKIYEILNTVELNQKADEVN